MVVSQTDDESTWKQLLFGYSIREAGNLCNHSLKYLIPLVLMSLLLTGLIGGASDNQSLLQIDPPKIFINGTLGTDSFQGRFNVTAVNQNITDLSFSRSSLSMIAPLGPWTPNILIPDNMVQVTPDVKKINKGQVQEYLIHVQNIPRSGRYLGRIYLRYKEQPVGVQESIIIDLVAYKLNASPVIVEFENGLFGLGGTGTLGYKIELREDSGQAPAQVIEDLARSMNASLGELVSQDDKSLKIRGADVFKLWGVGIEKDGIVLHANITNPEKNAGTYTGTLTVQSDGSLWPVISIPVEFRIRPIPWWSAFLLIFFGVLTSYLISSWNTKGRENNSIRHDISRIRDRLRGAGNKDCRKKIEDLLSEANEYLYDDKRKEAREKVDAAEAQLKTCEEAKKKLDEKAEALKELIVKLEEDEKRAAKILLDAGVAEPKKSSGLLYLDRLEMDLRRLQEKAEVGFYSSVEEKKRDWDENVYAEKSLDERLTDWSDKLSELNKLLEGLEKLQRETNTYEADLRETLRFLVGRNIDELKGINCRKDLQEAYQNVEKRQKQFNDANFREVIRLLTELEKSVKSSPKLSEEKKNCYKHELDRHKGSLAAYPASLDNIKAELQKMVKKIEAKTPKDEVGQAGLAKILKPPFEASHLKSPEIEALWDTMSSKERIESQGESQAETPLKQLSSKINTLTINVNPPDPPFPRGREIVWTAAANPDLPDRRTQFKFILNGKAIDDWTADNTFTWVPGDADDRQNILKVEARYEGLQDSETDPQYFKFELKPRELSPWDRIRAQWTPEREKYFREGFHLFIAFVLAAAIGYGQHYTDGLFYGAENTWLGYLTLFLWGFGIEASTTKAAEFFKSLGVE